MRTTYIAGGIKAVNNDQVALILCSIGFLSLIVIPWWGMKANEKESRREATRRSSQ